LAVKTLAESSVSNLREIVAEIKVRTDCRALAEEFGLPRRYDRFRCPFHDDHNPDLSVQPDGYCCFACGAKGDCFGFVRGVKNVGFREAMEFLAARCGVALPAMRGGRGRRGVRPQAAPQVVVPRPVRDEEPPDIEPERRIAIYTAFAEAGCLQLDHAPHAPAFGYLKRRGISPSTAIDAGLAFVADYGLAANGLRKRASVAELQGAKLFNSKGNFKLFKHCLVIPYRIDGEVVTIQARNIDWRGKDDGPKELTIGPVTIPYNADVLLEPLEQVYICEGAIDALSLLELGLAAVGIPGARNFRPEWAELFADVEEVILALDNDEAGHDGAAIIAGYFERVGREVKRLELPDGVKDINEFLTARESEDASQ
jgi:DNA primase